MHYNFYYKSKKLGFRYFVKYKYFVMPLSRFLLLKHCRASFRIAEIVQLSIS